MAGLLNFEYFVGPGVGGYPARRLFAPTVSKGLARVSSRYDERGSDLRAEPLSCQRAYTNLIDGWVFDNF